MKETLVIIVFVSILILCHSINKNNMIYLKGPDNNYYLVQNTNKAKSSVNMLVALRQDLMKLANYITNKPKSEYTKYIKRINERFGYVIIKENYKNSDTTSYSLNKGEELVFCIKSKNLLILSSLKLADMQ